MAKSHEDLVKKVLHNEEDLTRLTTDKIEEMAPQAEISAIPKDWKKIAKDEGIPYIEPKRTLKAFGKLPEKLKRQRDHDWEYVKGIYENYVVSGEALTFWLSLYPGDPDCMWEIPANKPVYIPRGVAKHLEEVQKYHTFDYCPLPESAQGPNSFDKEFRPTGTHYRGKFRPIGAFN